MTERTFASPPSLAPLFARAVLTGRLHRSSALDERVYGLAEQLIDGDRLAAYQRVCGYRVSDLLPAAYLHILAFPLSVARMVEADFPLPLLGLIHVNNSINQLRPVTLDERVTLRVGAAALGPHPAGTQVEFRASASVGAELVWSSVSTYLHRQRRSARPPTDRAATVPAPAPSAIIRVPSDIGRRYAAVSGDRNPIHLHPLAARALGFPRAIAHGMWLQARLLATLEGRLPGAFVAEAAFKTPVPLPASVALAAEPATGGWNLELRDTRSGRPHLTGTVRGAV